MGYKTRLIFPQTCHIRSLHNLARIRSQSLDKNSGFVEEDSGGRSNIFSAGNNSSYTDSSTKDKVAEQGLGGFQGIAILVTILLFVLVSILNYSNNKASYSSGMNMTKLDSLTIIATRLQ